MANDNEHFEEYEDPDREHTEVTASSDEDGQSKDTPSESGKESGPVKTAGDSKKKSEDKHREEFCYMCKRSDRYAGKLIHMPNNINICQDCMQKTFDNMGDFNGQIPGLEGLDLSNLFSDGNAPRFSFLNMTDLQNLQNLQTGKPKVKRKADKKAAADGEDPEAGAQEKKGFDRSKIPVPHKIEASLSEYVIGQEHAKKVMSVAVYNHYKRVAAEDDDDGIEIEKSNMLMIGPTGCGKTYLVKTLARLLDVPLAIADATSLTEAGYIGDDIESVLSKLLAAADNDVERAEHGIVFVDEIDKLAKKKNANQRDVSGESVQQGMLKLLEGAQIEVPVGASSKNAMVPMTTIDTTNILFICGGAFPGLEDIIKERLNEHASVGFFADLKDKYDRDSTILQQVTNEDIRKYGMIPEFIGRLPVIFSMEELTEEMLVRILTEPKNAITKQYAKLLAMDEVQLKFTDDALLCIAQKAKEKKVGARALRSVIEEFMLDIMYEIPKDDNIGTVTITRDYIEKKGGPIIQMRGVEALPGPA